MAIKKEIIQELAKDIKSQEEVFGPNGIIKQLSKHLLEAALQGEMTHNLGYKKHDKAQGENARNGYSQKQLQTDQGAIELEVPRDRQSKFDPIIIPKRQSRVAGLDDKIIAMYARGMSTRDIQSQLEEMYGVEISTGLITTVTDAVIDEVKAWQCRPLERIYPILYLDCLFVKVQENKQVINKAVYLALGVNTEGQKELLGMWICQNEGAKFWLSVLTEIKNRGVERIFIACVDGLNGFPEAIESVYPQAKIQLCIVHLIRNSLKYVNWKDRKIMAADLKAIYGAKTVDEAEMALLTFAEKWDKQYPTISTMWQRHWARIIPFFAYPMDIRKAVYTTNAIESLNMTLRKFIKNKRIFPSDEAVFKMLYLAVERIAKKWTMPIKDWNSAINRFMIEFPEAFPA
jgi:transposase-like protein